MATSRLEIIIEAQNQAKRQLDQLSDQLRTISDDQRDFAQATENAQQSFLGFTSQIGLGVLAANLAESALRSVGRGLKNFFSSSIETALSVERLSATLPVLARNTGKTEAEINKIIFAIREENKSIKEATEITQGIVLAGLDEVAALKLLAVARDIGATVGRSSADTNRLILESFQTLNPGILKQIGINISLNTTYRDLAEQLGKNVTDLTTLERQQGLLNAIFVQGENFAGAYDAAMTTVQKVTNSVKDASADLQFVMGALLTEGFFPIVEQALGMVRTFRAWAITSDNEINPALQRIADTIGTTLNNVFNTMLDLVAEVRIAFRELKENIEALGIAEPIALIFSQLAQVWRDQVLPVLQFLLGDTANFRLLIQALFIGIALLIVGALIPLALIIAKVTLVVIGIITVIRILKAVFTALFFAAIQLGQGIARVWNSITNAITVAVTAIREAIVAGFTAIKEFLANTWQSIKDSAFGALEAIVGKIREVISSITAIPRSIASATSGAFARARSFVGLQEGGIVTRPTAAIVGEAGPEAVIPLRKLGGGLGGSNITININGTVFSDDAERLMQTIGDALIDRLGLNIRIG